MGKKNIKKHKRKGAKKVTAFSKISKMVGLAMAGVVGTVAVSVGAYALFGGFKEKVVDLEKMYFEKSAYVVAGEIQGNAYVDTSLKLIPDPEDATKLAVTLMGGEDVVTYSEAEVGKGISLKLNQDLEGNVIGGEFELIAESNENLLTAKTNVFVDSRIKDITLTEYSGDIYPGTKFTVGISNIYPSNALNKPTSSIYKSLYGENYFNKTARFYSSNESVAIVDEYTGEVTVVNEGQFQINVYIPTTFESNATLPLRQNCLSDSEYFSILENSSYVCFKNTAIYSSKTAEVSGITATNNVFNLYVFEEYEAFTNSSFAVGENKYNFDIELEFPETNISQLIKDYKLKDVEIFEGFKEGDSYFISSSIKNKVIDEEGGLYDANTLVGDYFVISKSSNPLYWTIIPIDYTSISRDLYLIVRVGKSAFDLSALSDVENTGVKVENYKNDNDYAYYAYIKVNTLSVSNTNINLTTQKIMATYSVNSGNTTEINDENQLSKEELLKKNSYLFVGDTPLNLYDYISEILPVNATYQEIHFFARENELSGGASIIETTSVGELNEILQVYTKDTTIIKTPYLLDENNNKVAYIKANNEGTVKIYAAIFKTDIEGNIVGATESSYPLPLITSAEITLIITQEVTISDEINIEYNRDNYKYGNGENAISSLEMIVGENAVISFDVTNSAGLIKAESEGFFTISSTNTGVVSLNKEINETTKISFTATQEGKTNIVVTYLDETIILFPITVIKNEIKSIAISDPNGYTINNNVIEFVLTNGSETGDSVSAFYLKNDATKKLYGSFNNTSVIVGINVEGGTENQELSLNTNIPANGPCVVEFDKINTETNYRQIRITPLYLTLSDTITFSVYANVSGGQIITSQTITIKIVMPESLTIEANRNINNLITIDTKSYEKVVSGQSIEIFEYLKINNDEGVGKLFKANYYDLTNNLADVNLSTIENDTKIKISLSIDFTLENSKKSITFEEYSYYLFIISKYSISTESLVVDAGEEVSASDLKAKITLYENKHSTEETTAYLGTIDKIVIPSTSGNPVITDVESNTYFSDKYIANIYSFNNSFDYIPFALSYQIDAENYYKTTGQISVNIISNVDVVNKADYLQNGEIVNVLDLFKLQSNNVDLDGVVISNVNFNKETVEILLANGIELYTGVNATGSKINSYGTTIIVASLKMPLDINIYEITGLKASVSAMFGGDELSSTIGFALNLQISTLELNKQYIINSDDHVASNDTIYLLNSDINNLSVNDGTTIQKIKNNFVKLAKVSNKNNLNEEAIEDVEVEIDKDNQTLTISLNYISYTLAYVNLGQTGTEDNEFINKKSDKLLIGRAYYIEDLVTINNMVKEIADYSQYCSFDVDGSYSYFIKDGEYLIFKENTNQVSSSVQVNFTILGEKYEFTYTVYNIEINFENDVVNTIYPKLTYEIFDENTFDIISAEELAKLNITSRILIDSVENNDYIIFEENYTKLKVINYCNVDGGINLLLEINISYDNHTPITLTRSLKLEQLDIAYIQNQTLLANKEYNLLDYFTLSANDTTKNLLIFKGGFEGESVSQIASLNTFILNIEQDKNYILEIYLKTNESSPEIKIDTINFNVKYYRLSEKACDTVTYIGQKLSRNDLLNYVELKNSSGIVVADLNDEIVFIIDGVEIQDYTKINYATTQVTARFNEISINFTIESKQIQWSSQREFSVYPDTLVSQYVKAYIDNGGEVYYFNSNLVYEINNSENIFAITKSADEKIEYVYSGTTLVAQLYKVNYENYSAGTLKIFKASSPIKVSVDLNKDIAEIDGIDLIFNIISLDKINNDDTIIVYAGENSTKLTNNTYFSKSGIKIPDIDFRVYSLINNGLNYSYYENNVNGNFVIVKNGEEVASIQKSTGDYRDTFVATSKLDGITLELHGFLKLTSDEYVLESLNNDYLTLTVEVQSISLTADNSKLSALDKDNNYVDYFIVETDSENCINNTVATFTPLIKYNESSELEINTIKFTNAYIGLVNDNAGILNFASQLYLLQNSEEISNFEIKLPNGTTVKLNVSNGTIQFSQENGYITDYIFCSFEYTVGSYVGSLYVVLKPDINIIFYYDSIYAEYQTVYSPASYTISKDSGNLFKFSEDILGSGTSNSFTINKEKSVSLNNTYADSYYELVYSNTSNTQGQMDITTISESDTLQKYYIRINIKYGSNNYNYYYQICINNVNVQIYNNEEHTLINENIDGNRLEIGNHTEVDLTKYLTINERDFNDESVEYFANRISFEEKNAENYMLTTDGIFIVKTGFEIIGYLSVKFVLFGNEYIIYIEGDSVEVNFEDLTGSNYQFGTGDTIYISAVRTDDEVIVSFLSSVPEVTVLDATIALSDFTYTTTGNIYTNDYFSCRQETATVLGETLYYYHYEFGTGNTFFTLIKYATYYKLLITENLVGEISFSVVANYSTISKTQGINVEQATISINYFSPSMIDGKMYQNLVCGQDFNLTNIVSGSALSFETLETTLNSSQYSIDGNKLTLESNIYSENTMVLKAIYNTSGGYLPIYIRVIPQYNYDFTNSNNNYYILKSGQNFENINLSSYAKIYKFKQFDATNEPVYTLISDYRVEVIEDETTTYNQISNIFSYSHLSSSSQFKVAIFDGENKLSTLIFNAVELIFTPLQLEKGQTISVKNLINSQINSSYLTYKDVKIDFESNDNLDAEGDYVVVNTDITSCDFSINGLSFSVELTFNNLEIDLNYTNPIIKETDGKFITFENMYATQEMKLSDVVTIIGSSEEINNDYSKLLFGIEILSRENYPTTGAFSYDISNSETENSITVKFNNTALFVITNNYLYVYSNLPYELSLKISISYKNRVGVENTFNVRLLPVKLSIINNSVNVSLVDSNRYYNLINNIAIAKTESNGKGEEFTQGLYNINLNDKIIFTVDGQTVVNNSMLDCSSTFSTTTGEAKIKGAQISGIDDYISASFSISCVSAPTIFTDAVNISLSSNKIVSTNNEYPITISAIRSSDTIITYTYVVQAGVGTVEQIFKIYDSSLKLLCEIYNDGTYTLHTNDEFRIEIEYMFNSIFTATSSVEFNADNTPLSINYSGLNFITENGIKYLLIYSGQTLNVSSLVDGASISDTDISLVTKSTLNNNEIIAPTLTEGVSEQYGYFVLVKNAQSVKVYVKICNYIITKLYDEDFVYPASNVVLGSTTYIKHNSTYTTLFVMDDNITYNIYDFVSITGDSTSLSYALAYVVEYNGAYQLNSALVELNNTNKTFTIKSSENTYYFEIYIKIADDTVENLRFRVLKVTNNTEEEISLYNGTYVDLTEIIKLLATNTDSSVVSNASVNLFDNLKIKINAGTSYIKNNVLYIQEDTANQIEISYSFSFGNTSQSVFTKIIKINLSSLEQEGNYILNNVNYTEFDFITTSDAYKIDIDEGYKLKGVKQVILDGINIEDFTYGLNDGVLITEVSEKFKIKIDNDNNVTFNITNINDAEAYEKYNYLGTLALKLELINVDSITTKEVTYTFEKNVTKVINKSSNSVNLKISSIKSITIGNNSYEIDRIQTIDKVKYYVVNNVIKISELGYITFYDNVTGDYISSNNLGIIYLTVELEGVYNGVAYHCDGNYKLNNYLIVKNGASFKYILNGEEITNTLRYTLSDCNGDMMVGTVIDGNNISVNGITINKLTGALTVNASSYNSEIKVYIKAYIPSDNLTYDESYKLFLVEV